VAGQHGAAFHDAIPDTASPRAHAVHIHPVRQGVQLAHRHLHPLLILHLRPGLGAVTPLPELDARHEQGGQTHTRCISIMSEDAMMAMRATGRSSVLVARNVHPEYREVLGTYAKFQGMPVEELAFDAESGQANFDDLATKLTNDTAAVIVQSPNFFGIIENVKQAAALAHEKGALLVVIFSEAVAMGIVEPPRDADIVAGELQSFAIAPSYGGPFAGIIACKEKLIRQIPGRLVGETKDKDGRRAFCLTLATREQHIRREKATSNICTNQALIALMATVFMSVYGKEGLRELATQNLSKAHYLGAKLKHRFRGPFFNEFVADVGAKDVAEINRALEAKKIIGGLPLGRFYPELKNGVLLCCTEMTRREDMDVVAEVMA
jgi:glycine dehydrogenase subunit 1